MNFISTFFRPKSKCFPVQFFQTLIKFGEWLLPLSSRLLSKNTKSKYVELKFYLLFYMGL
jgi:hypothetical protein